MDRPFFGICSTQISHLFGRQLGQLHAPFKVERTIGEVEQYACGIPSGQDIAKYISDGELFLWQTAEISGQYLAPHLAATGLNNSHRPLEGNLNQLFPGIYNAPYAFSAIKHTGKPGQRRIRQLG